jgi:hypothetical protein
LRSRVKRRTLLGIAGIGVGLGAGGGGGAEGAACTGAVRGTAGTLRGAACIVLAVRTTGAFGVGAGGGAGKRSDLEFVDRLNTPPVLAHFAIGVPIVGARIHPG